MKKVIVFCASGYAQRVIFLLDDSEYHIVGLSDSNPKSWGETRFGFYVYSPAQIKDLEYDYVIISVSLYGEEIKNELIDEYGILEDKIIVFQPMQDGVMWIDERVLMLRKCVEMVKERGVLGSLAEVGVYKGDFAKLLNRYLPDRSLYLFDTFEGFDNARDSVNDCDLNNFKDTSVDIVLSKMVTPENCIVKQGYFPDTTDGVSDTFSIVSLDADLYNPIFAGLDFFYPRLSEGGYIFVHDFGSFHYEGVKKAVYDYCKINKISILPIVDRCLSVIITK